MNGTIAATIVRDIAESDRDDPNDSDTLCINRDALLAIIKTRLEVSALTAALSTDTLREIAEQLSIMLASSESHHDEHGTLTGYTIKTGALHRILGILAGAALAVAKAANDNRKGGEG